MSGFFDGLGKDVASELPLRLTQIAELFVYRQLLVALWLRPLLRYHQCATHILFPIQWHRVSHLAPFLARCNYFLGSSYQCGSFKVLTAKSGSGRSCLLVVRAWSWCLSIPNSKIVSFFRLLATVWGGSHILLH